MTVMQTQVISNETRAIVYVQLALGTTSRPDWPHGADGSKRLLKQSENNKKRLKSRMQRRARHRKQK